jgi:hypothetical protein
MLEAITLHRNDAHIAERKQLMRQLITVVKRRSKIVSWRPWVMAKAPYKL